MLGLGLREVTIIPNYEEGTAGTAAHGGEWGGGDQDVELLHDYAEDAFWLRHAISCYAGGEAVRQFGFADWREGTDDDWRDADDAINRITDDSASLDLWFALAKRRCELLVLHYKVEIEAVAEALKEAKTLSGEQVKAIFSQSLRPPGFRLWSW